MTNLVEPKVLITEEQIQECVLELASEISLRFKNEVPVFICILSGASVFFCDLIRALQLDIICDFIAVSSYKRFSSTGQVKILSDIETNLKDKRVVLVEDIIDSGLTMHFLQSVFLSRGAKDVTTVTLLHKPEATKSKCQIDYKGFEIGNEFVVGYGMDYKNSYRNLPFIGIIPKLN